MTGALLIGVGAVGLITTLYFPMNQRAPAGTTSDAPHVVLTAVISLFIIAAVVAGSTLHGKKFRLYSWGTLATSSCLARWRPAREFDSPRTSQHPGSALLNESISPRTCCGCWC